MPPTKCTECGTNVPVGALRCTGCGAPFEAASVDESSDSGAATPKRAWPRVLIATLILGAAFWYWFGLYSLQPIGALPEGRTVIVRRIDDEPFFNSADGTCLRRTGKVSLLCRGMAMGDGPVDRIVLRLPYMRWAYLASTGGAEFDR